MSQQPPQPPWGQQPPPQQPWPPQGYPPAAKKRRKWPWIVGGIFVVGALGCVGVFTLIVGGTAHVANELDQNAKGQNAVAAKMNQATTDGKFTFTVTGMKCGATQVGSDMLGEKAQGQFCLVTVKVKNTGTSAEMFNDSSQKAYDATGAEYSVDSAAGLYVNKEHQTFLQDINPGNTVAGQLVFDVPQGTKLTSVVLHESQFTAGIKVPVST